MHSISDNYIIFILSFLLQMILAGYTVALTAKQINYIYGVTRYIIIIRNTGIYFSIAFLLMLVFSLAINE